MIRSQDTIFYRIDVSTASVPLPFDVQCNIYAERLQEKIYLILGSYFSTRGGTNHPLEFPDDLENQRTHFRQAWIFRFAIQWSQFSSADIRASCFLFVTDLRPSALSIEKKHPFPLC